MKNSKIMYFHIINVATGGKLHLSHENNDVIVKQGDLDEELKDDDRYEWRFEKSGSGKYYRIINRLYNYAIGALIDGQKSNGNVYKIDTFNNHSAMDWKLEDINGNGRLFEIIDKENGINLCTGWKNNDRVYHHAKTDAKRYQWLVVPQGVEPGLTDGPREVMLYENVREKTNIVSRDEESSRMSVVNSIVANHNDSKMEQQITTEHVFENTESLSIGHEVSSRVMEKIGSSLEIETEVGVEGIAEFKVKAGLTLDFEKEKSTKDSTVSEKVTTTSKKIPITSKVSVDSRMQVKITNSIEVKKLILSVDVVADRYYADLVPSKNNPDILVYRKAAKPIKYNMNWQGVQGIESITDIGAPEPID